MDVEEVIKKFVLLAKTPDLTKGELQEAHSYMIELKKSGMSTDEISKAVNGRWSVSTIKGYTVGIKAPSPSPWQDVVSAVTDIIAKGISLNDILSVLSTLKDLEIKKINLDDVADFFAAAESNGVEPVALIEWIKEFSDSGITIKGAIDIMETKKQMDSMGVNWEVVPAIAALCKKFGNQQAVMDAVSAYGSNQKLQDEINAGKNELEKIAAEQAAADQKLKKAQEENDKLQEPMAAYKKAVELGFGEKQLADLCILVAQYGGVKEVFQALKKYADLAKIQKEVTEVRSEFWSLKSEISKAQAEYSHLTAAIKMCNSLISEHHYGLDAIGTILSVARKFGEPINVLKGIEVYGQVEALKKEAATLIGTIAELEEQLVQLRGKRQEEINCLESLHTTALKAGAEVSKVEQELKASNEFFKIVKLISDPNTADYLECVPVVTVIGVALRKWVIKHEKQLRFFYSIKSGLDSLLTSLGVS